MNVQRRESETGLGISFTSFDASDLTNGMDRAELVFNMMSVADEMEAVVRLAAMSSKDGDDDLSAFMFNVKGYDDPAIIIRGRNVFGEMLTAEIPSEIIRAEELDEAKIQELMDIVLTQLENTLAVE